MTQKPVFILPLPDCDKMPGWRSDHYLLNCERREFVRKCNAALIAIQDAATKFQAYHPDENGKSVAAHNLPILKDLISPLDEMIAEIAGQSSEHSGDFDLLADFDRREENQATIEYWEREFD